jgi:hypothetical protein
MSSDSWQCQGREDHGYFGSGTCPHADDSKMAPCANCLNAASDCAIEAAMPFMPPAVAAMFRTWLAQDRGRAVLHQAVQKIAALGGVDRASFRRAAQWTHDTGEDVRGMVRNVVASAKTPVAAAVDKAGALLAKQVEAHGPIFLGALARVAGALAPNAQAAEPAATAVSTLPKAVAPIGNAKQPANPGTGPSTGNDQSMAAFRAKFDAATKAAYKEFPNNCSGYLHKFLTDMGIPKQKFTDANDFMTSVTKKGSGWVQVIEKEAVSQSAAGKIVVAGLADTRPGHSGHVMVVGQKMLPASVPSNHPLSPQVFGGASLAAHWAPARSTGQYTVADAWIPKQRDQVQYWVKQ